MVKILQAPAEYTVKKIDVDKSGFSLFVGSYGHQR